MDHLNLYELTKCPLPLGLKLTLTPEMLPLIEEQKTNAATSKPLQVKKDDKLKAAHFPIFMLMIGYFKIEAKYPAELVAKFYYAKRKMVWEILRDGLKEKIEVRWQNISAIRAFIENDSPGILEIELDKVPSFFREIEPKPGKHTVWTMSHDFTDGQASKYRRHYLQFPPGVLHRYYAKLMQCDHRLLELSRKPFLSSHAATYFDSHLDQTTQLVFCHHYSENSCVVPEPLPISANYYINLTSGEAINNPMQTNNWSQDFRSDTLLSMESGLNYEQLLPSQINNMLLTGYSIPEIELNTRDNANLVSPMIEVSLACNTNTSTQIDWSYITK